MVDTIPSYEGMMPVVLKVLANGQQKTLKQVYDDVAALYGFSEEQLVLTLPSGKQTYIRSRVGWAKTYLVKAGLIHQPKRGICEITNSGRKLWRAVSLLITTIYLCLIPLMTLEVLTMSNQQNKAK